MLDLNLDLDSKEVSGAVLNQMDESVTSNSSLVNAEASSCIDGEEEMCSAPAVKFQFEILKGGDALHFNRLATQKEGGVSDGIRITGDVRNAVVAGNSIIFGVNDQQSLRYRF